MILARSVGAKYLCLPRPLQNILGSKPWMLNVQVKLTEEGLASTLFPRQTRHSQQVLNMSGMSGLSGDGIASPRADGISEY